jgi:hypothetical protein
MSFDDRILNGVSALAAAVRSGGFAAAARSLNVSQPGISLAVARLEAQVGIRLLERTTRSVSLTDGFSTRMTASGLCPCSQVEGAATIPLSSSMPGSIPQKEPTIFSSERVGAR